MMRLDQVLYWTALISAALATTSFPTAIANDWPVHTVVVTLVACGISLISIEKIYPDLFTSFESRDNYSLIPLNNARLPQTSRKSSAKAHTGPKNPSSQVSRRSLVFAILVLSLRIELYRRISGATECRGGNVEVFLPLLVAIYDCVRFQKTTPHRDVDCSGNLPKSGRLDRLHQLVLRSRLRYVLPASGFSYGSWLLLRIWDGANSTYICPLVVQEERMVPSLQFLAVLLDSCMLATIVELVKSKNGSKPTILASYPLIWAVVLLVVSVIWACIGAITYFAKPEWRSLLVDWDVFFSFDFSTSLTLQVTHIAVLCLSSLYCIMQYGLLYMTMILMALFVTIPSLQYMWHSHAAYPPYSNGSLLVASLFMYGGWTSFDYVRQLMGLEKRRSAARQVTALAVVLILLSPLIFKSPSVTIHPIEALMETAKLQHQRYVKASTRGHTLQDAVVEYKRRYSMRPPPGFDIWYEYASNLSTTIVDDFDQIYDDLLPFRSISPGDLRRQTWEMVSNPWNEISGITIRKGTAAVQDNVLPTHRWMLEGVAILINAFAQHLPDMDLAFNLNDESRVAVPFADITRLRTQAHDVKLSGFSSWSTNRSEGWLPIPEEEYRETIFRDMSFRNTFSKYGSVGCAPSSKARRVQHLASQSHVCVDCVAPHSEGQFVADWALAADICHQPDLARLHGFYSSPAAFKTSHYLMPVFSQSKPHGYNDILYPSAWNYMDKAVYAPSEPSGEFGTDTFQPGFPDPDFRNKKNTLFWRGATSEGVSSGDHAWRGMTRQRLVHMANNLTSSRHDYATVLLPGKDDGFTYQTIAGPSVKDLGLSTDVAIVDHIARCGGIGLHDCTDQEKEFALVPPSDFQSHWKYRYLFDLDGAGFSGRFLPFVQSKSLPFKTALFREWYDSRLVAWRHFVPQDLRLHGVWSTLAYFAGVNGTVNGRKYEMKPHLKEAETIATAGREWAAKVLRKEDMELYFFRLLLEWGRLTDDRRDELGFSI